MSSLAMLLYSITGEVGGKTFVTHTHGVTRSRCVAYIHDVYGMIVLVPLALDRVGGGVCALAHHPRRQSWRFGVASLDNDWYVLCALSPGGNTFRNVAHMSCLKHLPTSTAVAEGEREILDGPNGPVLVTKVAGNYYAVDATCPHLGLPMKKGKISTEDGTPTLTCNFHNSCFSLETGACTKWVTGALGVQNKFVSGLMGKVGAEKQDIKAYSVTENEDGSLTIE
eukprot:scaffold3181_cov167-Amphora_coffeaeformis.AAC.4